MAQTSVHLIAVPDSVILEIAQLLSLPDWEPKKLLFEQIIPKLSDFLRLSSYKSYHDFFIALLEATAEQYQINRFRLYDVPQFIEAIQQHQASAMKKEHALSFPFFHTTENLQQAVEKLAIALCQICSST